MLSQLEVNGDNVLVNRRPGRGVCVCVCVWGGGEGGTPLLGLKGYVPLNKLVFKDSRESQTGYTILLLVTAARLAQWDKGRSAVRDAVGSNPRGANTKGL